MFVSDSSLTICVFPWSARPRRAEALPRLALRYVPEPSTVPALYAVSARLIAVPALNESAVHNKRATGSKGFQ